VRVAIIPARGGSKRIPKKNIKLFHGKPIITYSIDAAIKSGLFDRVIVSTDDLEIAKVANDSGAETPFIRPAELSDDHTGTNAVVCHAINFLQSQGDFINYACCIYATAPLIQIDYLRQGYKKLINENKKFVFPVTNFPFPIQRAVRISDLDGNITPFDKASFSKRSQDLQECYHDAGQFYWGTPQAFSSEYDLFTGSTGVIKLPRNYVCDIDTPEDWCIAEALYLSLKSKCEV
jgi:pseudaminic acid cytidylyltransferase